MKATLTPEKPVFELDVHGTKVPGMKQEGQLGPVLWLRSDQGHEAYVYDGGSAFAEAFGLMGHEGSPRGATLIAGNSALKDAIHPPDAGADDRERDGHLEDRRWYWVRYRSLVHEYEAPAMYRSDAQAFYSVEFSGVPRREVLVMGAMSRSKTVCPE